jgi:hypothetical protein
MICLATTKPTAARDAYIQTRYGFYETGLRAIQMAAAIPIVTQKRAETKRPEIMKNKDIRFIRF